MKKEVTLAIAIGFTLGLIITYGVWIANKSLKTTPTPSPTPTQTTPAPVNNIPTTTNSLQLSISTPDDELLTNTDTTTISGQTVPGATVSVIYESGEALLVADDKGKFSQDIPLDGGYNQISISAFDTKGNSATQNLLVTYTSQKI
jgi:hypothetical protein